MYFCYINLLVRNLYPPFNTYGKLIDKAEVNTEYEIRQLSWKSSQAQSVLLLTDLEKCDEKLFLNRHTLL